MDNRSNYSQYLQGAILNKHHYNKESCSSHKLKSCNHIDGWKIKEINNNSNLECNNFENVLYEYESLNCISNEKSKKALYLKEEANKIVQYAIDLREEAENVKQKLENIIYESEQCLKKAHELNIESNLLMAEANIALNKEIEGKQQFKSFN